VDDRLTKEELDLWVAQVLASRTRADLAAVTADMPAGLNVSQPSARSTAKVGTAKVGTAKVRAAGVGVTGAAAVAVTVVLVLVTSIPPLFLVIVSCYFTAMIVAGAWVLSSRYGKHAG